MGLEYLLMNHRLMASIILTTDQHILKLNGALAM